MDIFATQFLFTINKQRNGKQTKVGQCISTTIISVSLAFLIYLLIKFFSGDLLPKITEVTEINQSNNSYEYDTTPFSLRLFFQDGRIPENFEMKRYFKYLVKYGEIWQNTTVDMELENCQQMYPDQIEEYHELDLCLQKDLKLNNFYDKIENYLIDTSINVILAKCIGPECATEDEIDYVLDNYQFLGLFTIRLNEYDYKNQKLKQVLYEKYIVLNSQNFMLDRYILKKTKITIDSGILISSYNELEYLHGIQEERTMVNNENQEIFQQIKQYKLIGFFSFPIAMNNRIITVEYPKITESLAQFVSIFNILSLFGFLGKLVSEIKIFEQIMESHVVFYYQKMIQKAPEKNKILSYNIYNSVKNYLKNVYYSKEKLKQMRQKEFCNNFCSSEKKDFIYNHLFPIVQNQFELDQLFKDIFFLKTCIQLLFTKEQYAAIRYTGRNPPEISRDIACRVGKIQDLNHLEQLDLIDKNIIVQENMFKNYQNLIQQNHKFSNNNTDENNQNQNQNISSLIDERIQSSILQEHQIQLLRKQDLHRNTKINFIDQNIDTSQISNKQKIVPSNSYISEREEINKQDSHLSSPKQIQNSKIINQNLYQDNSLKMEENKIIKDS